MKIKNKIIAINLHDQGSQPAPKEWMEIKEILAQRPSPFGQEVSLQKIDNTDNICVWMTNKNGYWSIASDMFLIKNN